MNGPPAPAQFDAYAGTYADAVNRSIGFLGVKVDYFTRVKVDYVVDFLTAQFGDAGTVNLLDVGCGVGQSHALLAPRVESLTGTDVSAPCLDQAATAHPDNTYLPYDGTRLPWADAQFDAAMTTCVMHHVPPAQWASFAAEMARVVRPGGLVLVIEHNPLNPLTRRAVSTCAFDEDAVLLGQRRTRALLAGAGLVNVQSRAILSIPPIGPVTRAIDLALGHLSLGAQYIARGTVTPA
ncbi:class I SAM-dependent methyltransferase [Novosphingobium sp.]|uniref:class I SAM-dependent methyltransferase n=1 Tax=Novosphingobium sp. TaxID=1874826 RepID=UPI003340D525